MPTVYFVRYIGEEGSEDTQVWLPNIHGTGPLEFMLLHPLQNLGI